MATALYNRYRPRTFSEVVGQGHVTDALAQALRSKRIHHAYLFSGPRGCGKTSSARILAASLNCIHGPTPEPCGVCDQCVGIRQGSSVDVIEIDAASHGLVEDTRDLRERAGFMPASGRYRVFVIDEAHMITTQGFNALLKIVEEPPEYVVFVFATTDPDKVLPTIRSRTFHYQFGLVPPRELEAHLTSICSQEGVTVDPAVLPLVVRVAEGSVRDSLSVLDQLLAGADDSGLSYAVAVARLGLTDALLLDEMVDGLARREAATVFGVVQRVVEAGQDPRRFTLDLLSRLRDLLLLEAVPDAPDRGMLDLCPADQLERMRGQAARLGSAELSRAADVTHTALVDMRGTTTPRMVLELLCARILLPGATGDATGLLVRLDRLERRMQAGGTVAAVTPPAVAPPALASPAIAVPAATPAPAASAARTPSSSAAPAPVDLPPVVVAAPAIAAASVAAGSEAAGPGAAAVSPPASPAPSPTAAPAESSARVEPAAPAGHSTAAAEIPAIAVPPIEAPVVVTTAGTIDLAGLRGMWPRVLDTVKSRSRTAHALLVPHADLASVDGSQLALSYANASISRQFFAHGGAHAEVLAEALTAELGGTWRITLASGPAAAAPVRPATPPPPAQSSGPAPDPWDEPPAPVEQAPPPPPEHSGFAPGDEPSVEDDSDSDSDTEDEGAPRLRGEDLAIDLLRSQMGAVVVGELDNT